VKRTILIGMAIFASTAFTAFPLTAHARQHASKQERIQACTDKASGDPCSYTNNGEAVDGTCKMGRRAKLLCVASSHNGGGSMSGTTSGGTGGPAAGDTGASGDAGGSMGGASGGAANGSTGGAEAPPATSPEH
jgi:hypothetical protein